MIVVGLTGGVASGKSFVSNYLCTQGYQVHESDSVITHLYNSYDVGLVGFLLKNGFEKYVEKKKINKKGVRGEIFKTKEKKNKLENYLHNKVSKDRKIFLKKNKNQKIVFLDIPLLFEKNLEKICDVVCSTIAPIQVRERRALRRPGMERKIFKKIIENQVGDKERKEKSNYLIKTTQTRKNTCLQVDAIIYDVINKK